MAQTRDNYQITGNSIPEIVTNLNFLLQRFADRMDKIEGLRGTAEINSDLDMNQNRVIDLNSSLSSTDGVNQGELSDQGTSTSDSPTFQNVTLDNNLTVSGTTTLTGNVAMSGNATVTGDLTVSGDTQLVGVDSTGGFTFTDPNSVVIHQMGGV